MEENIQMSLVIIAPKETFYHPHFFFLVFVMKILIHSKQGLEASLTTKYLQLFEFKERVRIAEI